MQVGVHQGSVLLLLLFAIVVYTSVPFKRKKSANLRNYVRRIRSQNSTVRKKSPAVFGNFFILLKFLQFC